MTGHIDIMRVTILVEPFKDKLDIHIYEIKNGRYKGKKFGINYRVFTDNGWKPIVRYDNHFHKGGKGGHLHRIDKDWNSPEMIDLEIEDAITEVKELGKKLRKKVFK